MTHTIAVPVEDGLVVHVSPGGEDWAYRVRVEHDGEAVTSYGSNFEPWGRGGVTMLGNIVATRLDEYGSREDVRAALEAAFDANAAALEAIDAG